MRMVYFLGGVVLALLLPGDSWAGGMQVDLYVHKDKFGKSLNLQVGESDCTNVPRLWANLTQSVDTHGSCMQFYDKKNCKGRIAVIQPFHTVHQMDLSLIQFHNVIQSVSACGPKVPNGRYVIQSAVDASMLTVQKKEGDFARVNTLPPQAFIPKAQQWEISEKAPNEYDIMPRIHETNMPVTYDGEAMKKGNMIRKIWKIESVGRGRYIIKSEWTQKCLYKTRIRTVEEHDCRAWSPNQEWVLRPLIAPTQPPPTTPTIVADNVNFQVPSRVVEKYLEEQKRAREKEQLLKDKDKKQSDDHVGSYLEPYRIKYRKTKPKNKKLQEESDEEEDDKKYRSRGGPFRQIAPPRPEIMYTRHAPIFNYQPGKPVGRYPQKVVAYMEGIAPIYEDAKMDDPTFPDFLLHAASEPDDSRLRYAVTRRPLQEPLDHPDYIPEKRKYDGRIKTPEVQEQLRQQANIYGRNDQEVSEEEAEEPSQEEKVSPGHLAYDGSVQVDAPNKSDKKAKSDGEDEEEGEEDSKEGEEESGEAEEEGDDESKGDKKKKPEEKEDSPELTEDDPAGNISGFMKLLLQGINNRMMGQTKKSTEMEQLLGKKKKK